MKTNVLVLKGGGIRGGLEAVLGARIDLAAPGFASRAHVIAGASVGAISACAIAAGIRWGALVSLFEKRGAMIFGRTAGRRIKTGNGLWGAKYGSEGLQELLLGTFGDMRLGELKQPVFIPAVDLDTAPEDVKPRRMRARFLHTLAGSADGNVRVVDGCMMSAAAPTYFRAHMGHWDGGLVANDPGLFAVVELIKMARAQGNPFNLDDVRMITLGTGQVAKHVEGDPDLGPIGALPVLLDVALDVAAGCLGHTADQLVGESARCDPWLTHDIALDDVNAIPELELIAQDAYLRDVVQLASRW